MIRIPPNLRHEWVYSKLPEAYFAKQRRVLDCVHDEVQFITIAGGIGASKSWTAARYLIPDIVLADSVRELNGWHTSQQPPVEVFNIWIVGADYDKPRMEWQYVVDTIQHSPYLLALCGGFTDVSQPRQGSWLAVTGNGCRIETRTWAMSSGSDPLHAVPVHAMLVAEAGLLDEWTWQNRLVPRIGRTNGYMVHAGTFEDAGPFLKELFRKGSGADPAHRAFSIASWENTFRYPGGRQDAAILMMESQMTPETFLERCAAIPKRASGLVHQAFEMDRHMRPIVWDPQVPTEIFVDPGANGYYVGVAQVVDWERFKVLHVLDEFYQSSGGTTDMAVTWLQSSEWAGRVSGGTNDVRMLEQASIWRGGAVWKTVGGGGLHLRSQNVPIGAGIERIDTLLHTVIVDEAEQARLKDHLFPYKETLGVTRLLIHPRCKRLLWEMSTGYKHKRARDGEAYNLPEDKHNNGCKALAYYAVDRFGFVEAGRRRNLPGKDAFAHIRTSPRGYRKVRKFGPNIITPRSPAIVKDIA